MSDIFHEVDEEVRRERLQKLWERYGHLMVAAAVIVVAGIAAWRGYGWWEAKKAAESGAAFQAAMSLSESGKHSEAEADFSKLAGNGTAGYRNLARLRAAADLADIDPKAATGVYEQIAGDSAVGPVLSDLAALRAGGLLIDAGAYDQARARLEPLTPSDRIFHHTAREFLVLAAWRAGEMDQAKRWIDMIMTDAQTPAGTRTRVEMLVALSGNPNKT